jgi:hypothetical protein
MQLFVQQLDAQIRFILKSEMKARLMREAKRWEMPASDLLRLYIEERLAGSFKNPGSPPGSGQAWKPGVKTYKSALAGQASGPGLGGLRRPVGDLRGFLWLLDAGLGAFGRQRPR